MLLGTFPPGSHRWSMDFYYPNATNDFWRIMGIIFEDDATALYDKTTRTFKLNRIKSLLDTYGIALSDTVLDARRTHGTASDKDLEVLRMRDIPALAAQIHDLRAIATTGQKAAEIVAAQTGTSVPSMGMHAAFDSLEIWRLPSTSRAYPMASKPKPYTTDVSSPLPAFSSHNTHHISPPPCANAASKSCLNGANTVQWHITTEKTLGSFAKKPYFCTIFGRA